MRRTILSIYLLLFSTTANAVRINDFEGSCTSDNVYGQSANGRASVTWIVAESTPENSAALLKLIQPREPKKRGRPLNDPYLFWWREAEKNIKLLVGDKDRGGWVHYFSWENDGYKYRRGGYHGCSGGIP